jgi:prepilin-type N-terminal cleavage/methylation domain-containing protein
MSAASRRHAFTIIELLVVMGIMVLMMTIAALSWTGMRRGAEVRGASATVRTALMLARQQAILRRQNVTVRIDDDGTKSYIATYTSTSAAYSASATGSVHAVASLTPGMQFDPSSLPIFITFKPNGGSGNGGKTRITVRERAGVGAAIQSATLTNWNLTGITE